MVWSLQTDFKRSLRNLLLLYLRKLRLNLSQFMPIYLPLKRLSMVTQISLNGVR